MIVIGRAKAHFECRIIDLAVTGNGFLLSILAQSPISRPTGASARVLGEQMSYNKSNLSLESFVEVFGSGRKNYEFF